MPKSKKSQVKSKSKEDEVEEKEESQEACCSYGHGSSINKDPSSICSSRCISVSLIVLAAAIITSYIIYNVNNLELQEPIRYNDVIPNASSETWFYTENFFHNDTIEQLRNMALNGESFATTVEDVSVESAGEAVPVGHADCRHPFMTLNLNRTICHFSNRLDVAMHFIKTGGFNGHIEYVDRMITRILPFRKRIIQQSQTTNLFSSVIDLKKLNEFNTPSFKEKVTAVCSNNKRFKNVKKSSIVIEMFQLDLLIMLPGQELPMHLNVPYFWGADRNTLPQWLLVAMKHSQLFDDLFIPQVQGVSWLDIEEMNTIETQSDFDYVDIHGDGGDFYLYPYKPEIVKKDESIENIEHENRNPRKNVDKYVIFKEIHNSAIFLNGAQVIHGVDRFKPNELPPLFSPNHHYTLRFDKEKDLWFLNDFKNNYLQSYYKDEIKFMITWNTHCFSSESEREKFRTQKGVNQLSLRDIMETFKRDLKLKESLPSDDIEPLELWTIVLKEYLKYPKNTHHQNSTIFGINYCLLPNLVPRWVTDNFLKPILNKRC